MIVNYGEKGWEVITQRAHGLLAMQLAMEWKKARRPSRWIETLMAIAEHDDAEVELDGEELLTPSGGPLNFTMKRFDLDHCSKVRQLSITKSRYIALLTSFHLNFLYQKEAKTNKTAAGFLREQHRLQQQWLKELGISMEEIKRVYSLLEWCDAFSLILCRQLIQPESRAIEISKGPDAVPYELYQLDKNKLTVCPWPFESQKFEVRYESRLIEQIRFAGSADFRKCFYQADVRETNWIVVKTAAPRKTKKV
jgi:hypothetical protein